MRLCNSAKWKYERDDRARLAVQGQPSFQIDLHADHRASPNRGLGDPETAAGEFVTGLELGVTSPYRTSEFRAAVSEVTNLETAARIRRKAAQLAPTFAS